MIKLGKWILIREIELRQIENKSLNDGFNLGVKCERTNYISKQYTPNDIRKAFGLEAIND